MEPQVMGILIVTFFFFATFAAAAWMIWRVMTKKNAHIGARMERIAAERESHEDGSHESDPR